MFIATEFQPDKNFVSIFRPYFQPILFTCFYFNRAVVLSKCSASFSRIRHGDTVK